ncbi:hypothetical protein [uncultured Reyranella sp.]|uniref:hypothetical protein n=1 Tax=uncultured Reyranella sp. TaxID=735512 RepID=UPI0025D4A4C4|nr:hypothetical protein [uncultured Reyranella sp.]
MQTARTRRGAGGDLVPPHDAADHLRIVAGAVVEFRIVNPEQGVTVANPYYVESPLLTAEEANSKYGITSNGKRLLGWDQPVREREAKELQGLKRDELLRQDIVSRGAGGFWQGTARLAVGLGASVVDPLNILSAFIPVVGEARFASILATIGSRMATRGIVGVTEGAVGAAMLEPLVYGLSQAEQRDYTMADSLQNVIFGGVLGGGLHIGGGIAKDRLFGISKIIDDAPLETKRAMAGDALVSVIEGRPVRADLALREHLLGGTLNLTPYEMVKARFDNAMGPFVPDPVVRDMGGGLRSAPDVPHPMPDRNGSFVPMIARNDELMTFTTRKRAENAMNRIQREDGIRPEIVETPNGFILRAESKMEPVRKTDGSPMLFPNERQAKRWLDQQVLKDGPDIDPVTGTGREYSVIPYSDGGRVQYALVEGATSRELLAAKRAPDQVEFAQSRDVPTMIRDEAQAITDARAVFDREYDQWLRDKLNPPVLSSHADLKVLAEANTQYAAIRGEAESIRREGGQTEATILDREIAELDKQIAAVDSVGELPKEAKAELDAGKAEIAQAEARASVFDRIAGCLRGGT